MGIPRGGFLGSGSLTSPSPTFQYLQLKEKLEHEFPGCLDIVSLGMGMELHGFLFFVIWNWEAVWVG